MQAQGEPKAEAKVPCKRLRNQPRPLRSSAIAEPDTATPATTEAEAEAAAAVPGTPPTKRQKTMPALEELRTFVYSY